MLTASDISPSFTDTTFTPDNTTPAPCGQPNVATQFPPVIDVGSAAGNSDGTLFFQEELTTFKDEATATKAFQAGLQGLSCTQGTVSNGSDVTISQPKDASTTVGFAGAIEIDIQSSDFTGQLFAARNSNAIVVFQFQGVTGADTSGVPTPEAIAKKGFQKLGG